MLRSVDSKKATGLFLNTRFTINRHGDVMLNQTLSVSSESTLNVTGSSENTEDADAGAVVTSHGTLLLFEVDDGSTVSLTGLTLYGGDGALRVTTDSFVEVVDCTFKNNKRTSSDLGGGLTRLISLYLARRTRNRLQQRTYMFVVIASRCRQITGIF